MKLAEISRLSVLAAALSACRSTGGADADVKVTNGLPTRAHPEIVLIDLAYQDDKGLISKSLCTGTFVGPTTVLTAAHCLKNQFPGLSFVGPTINGVKPVKASVHPLYTQRDPPVDLALLLFPPDLGQAIGVGTFGQLAANAPVVGQSVQLIGFGQTDLNDAGSSGGKHKGDNAISAVGNGVFSVTGVRRGVGTGTNASAGHGDSGGPALTDPGGKIIGVVSGSENQFADPVEVQYVDVTSAKSRSFFDAEIACQTAPCADKF